MEKDAIAEVAAADKQVELEKALQNSQTNEVMRLARTFVSGDVKILERVIRSKKTRDSAKVTAIKLMHEIAYPKSTGGPAKGGGPAGAGAGPTQINITFLDFDDPSGSPGKQMTTTAVPVKKLPANFDESLDG